METEKLELRKREIETTFADLTKRKSEISGVLVNINEQLLRLQGAYAEVCALLGLDSKTAADAAAKTVEHNSS